MAKRFSNKIVQLLSRNFGGVGDGADKSTNFFYELLIPLGYILR